MNTKPNSISGFPRHEPRDTSRAFSLPGIARSSRSSSAACPETENPALERGWHVFLCLCCWLLVFFFGGGSLLLVAFIYCFIYLFIYLFFGGGVRGKQAYLIFESYNFPGFRLVRWNPRKDSYGEGRCLPTVFGWTPGIAGHICVDLLPSALPLKKGFAPPPPPPHVETHTHTAQYSCLGGSFGMDATNWANTSIV